MIILERHVVEDNSKERRLVDYCINLFPQLQTRNAVKKALKRGELLLNGEVATTGEWISEGDQIQLIEGQRKIPKHFPLEVPILYEDEYLVVVDKPSGLVVSGNKYQTLENALVNQTELSKRPDALQWAVPVHRLDGPTSGIVICAKTYSARISLMQQFENRRVQKIYHAVVMGDCEKRIEIEEPIEGLESSSILTPVRCVPSLRSQYMTLVKLQPKTGRTHQLRIHCQFVGHPIVGDKEYGEEGNTLLHKGLFLAATELNFKHPNTEEELCVSIDIPKKFGALLDRETRRFDKYNSAI